MTSWRALSPLSVKRDWQMTLSRESWRRTFVRLTYRACLWWRWTTKFGQSCHRWLDHVTLRFSGSPIWSPSQWLQWRQWLTTSWQPRDRTRLCQKPRWRRPWRRWLMGWHWWRMRIRSWIKDDEKTNGWIWIQNFACCVQLHLTTIRSCFTGQTSRHDWRRLVTQTGLRRNWHQSLPRGMTQRVRTAHRTRDFDRTDHSAGHRGLLPSVGLF